MNVANLEKYKQNTNKKLLYAAILLELSEKEEKQHYKDALEQSCLTQLKDAYYTLLEEQQRSLNILPEYGCDAVKVVESMKKHSIHCAILEDLAKQETDDSSWVFAMQLAYNRDQSSFFTPSMQYRSNNLQTRSSIISTDTRRLNLQLGEWIKKVENLCDNLRNSLTEY